METVKLLRTSFLQGSCCFLYARLPSSLTPLSPAATSHLFFLLFWIFVIICNPWYLIFLTQHYLEIHPSCMYKHFPFLLVGSISRLLFFILPLLLQSINIQSKSRSYQFHYQNTSYILSFFCFKIALQRSTSPHPACKNSRLGQLLSLLSLLHNPFMVVTQKTQ